MIQNMKITSIHVPEETNVVIIGVDLGIPGAHGEFRLTTDQAAQLGHDLIGAAKSCEPISINAAGGRNYGMKCDPGNLILVGKPID